MEEESIKYMSNFVNIWKTQAIPRRVSAGEVEDWGEGGRARGKSAAS